MERHRVELSKAVEMMQGKPSVLLAAVTHAGVSVKPVTVVDHIGSYC